MLTDLEYSFRLDPGQFAGNRLETPVILREGGTDKWGSWAVEVYLTQASFELRDMVSKTFATGVVFSPGSQVNLYHHPGNHTGEYPSVQSYWRISWNGYLTTAVASGAEDAPGSESGDVGLGLESNAPNPFMHATSIRFTLPENCRITLRIVDARGRVVRSVLDGLEAAGEHQLTWDGRDEAGHPVAAGVYFVDLVTPNGRESRKVIAID